MSRIGKRPVSVPNGVQVTYENRVFSAKGPKGEISCDVPDEVELKLNEGEVEFIADFRNDRDARRMLGTTRAVVNNLVTGVHEGFERRLQLVGVGYRAQVQGQAMELNLGYSLPVKFAVPEGVTAQTPSNTEIILTSHDKVLLGSTAAKIRGLRPPEPFQGKGIRYLGERVRRKAGKSGKK